VTRTANKRVAFAADDKLLLLWAANEVEIVEAGSWRHGQPDRYRGDIALHPCERKTRGSRRPRRGAPDITRPSSRDYLWPDDQ